MPEQTSKGFNVEIGDQKFHLNFQTEDRSLLRYSKNVLKSFSKSSRENCCNVEIILYSCKKDFLWKPSELDRFRKYFIDIAMRFPLNDQPAKIADSCLGILKCLDPAKYGIKRILSRIDESSALIYSRIISDIYFFDTESRSAVFFIKKSNKNSHMGAGIMNGLMFMLSHLLIHDNGLLVHGSALQRDNRTVLFLGLSGAGKSTITNLCKPDTCFSDDGVVLKRIGNRLYAYRSPFTQTERDDNYPYITKGEVEKIFLLEKGNQHNILPIRKAELMIMMVTSLIHFFKYINDDTARVGFHIVKDMLDTVPSFRLEFAKKEKIWEKIISN